ncbi:MAG: hypothetical protein HKN29_07125 [Rhodothermales bacterium]|nr:hypothetical protein [Rhodothermales bacterium]
MERSAGADRIELCVDLPCGGLTPSPDLVHEVVSVAEVPVMVLIRSRPGDFVFDRHEVDKMANQVRASRAAGASGVVIGSLTADGEVNAAHVRALVDAAEGLPVTFHRAIDHAADVRQAHEVCAGLGIDRVLTSGGAETALDGADVLAELNRRAGPRVLAAGGIRADHVIALIRTTGVREIHARASAVPALLRVLGSAD